MTIRITYDSINLDLLIGPKGLDPGFEQERNQNRSGSGKIEQINQYGIQTMALDAYLTVATYYDALAWWSWARQGKPFSVAMDSTQVFSENLDGAAASGQKVIPLATTSGTSVDDVCIIETLSDDQFEIVEIASISAGVSVTAKSNLKQTYASGDKFRHFEYYPNCISLDKKFNPTKTGKYFRHTFNFVEVKGNFVDLLDTGEGFLEL